MGWFKRKRRRDDDLFSDYLRAKRNWTCERCKKYMYHQRHILDASHYVTCENETLRFDEENVRVLCRGCHIFFHKHPYEHTKFMEELLGEQGLQMVIVRGQKFTKRNKAYIKSNCKLIKLKTKYLEEHV